MMIKRMVVLLFGQLMIMIFCLNGFADAPIPGKKQTLFGKYATAKQAYQQYTAHPDRIHLLDVRTPGEYLFVGHAPWAKNIPFVFLEPGVSARKGPVMILNENFISEVMDRFKKSDTLYVMCRSGGRSAAAVNQLARAGFTTVYNIIDGFEGDRDQNGKRTRNGWKNSGLPWTYDFNPDLAYIPLNK